MGFKLLELSYVKDDGNGVIRNITITQDEVDYIHTVDSLEDRKALASILLALSINPLYDPNAVNTWKRNRLNPFDYLYLELTIHYTDDLYYNVSCIKNQEEGNYFFEIINSGVKKVVSSDIYLSDVSKRAFISNPIVAIKEDEGFGTKSLDHFGIITYSPTKFIRVLKENELVKSNTNHPIIGTLFHLGIKSLTLSYMDNYSITHLNHCQMTRKPDLDISRLGLNKVYSSVLFDIIKTCTNEYNATPLFYVLFGNLVEDSVYRSSVDRIKDYVYNQCGILNLNRTIDILIL